MKLFCLPPPMAKDTVPSTQGIQLALMTSWIMGGMWEDLLFPISNQVSSNRY